MKEKWLLLWIHYFLFISAVDLLWWQNLSNGPKMTTTQNGDGVLLTHQKDIFKLDCTSHTSCIWKKESNSLQINRKRHLMFTVPSTILENCNNWQDTYIYGHNTNWIKVSAIEIRIDVCSSFNRYDFHRLCQIGDCMKHKLHQTHGQRLQSIKWLTCFWSIWTNI